MSFLSDLENGKATADYMHVDADDYISVLKNLGKECLGAIQIIDESEKVEAADYKELSKADVKTLAEEGVRQAVKDAALELKQSGFSEAGKIAERICVNLCSPAVTD